MIPTLVQSTSSQDAPVCRRQPIKKFCKRTAPLSTPKKKENCEEFGYDKH